MHQHDTQQHNVHNNNNNIGVERLIRKKPKLESKVLNISSAADAARGPRESMEDTHTVRDDLKFYGVYDGHGGEQAAKLLQDLLHTHIVNSNHYLNGNIEEAIHEAFKKVDNQILQESMDQKWDSGTTAVVALIQDHKLYIANCGDSEAVLGRRKTKKVIPKSKDTNTNANKIQNRSRPTTPLSCAISDDNTNIDNNLSTSSCSLSDSMGMSPTAVLSHLSLASPRKAVPRFRSRNNSFSDALSDNANSTPSTPSTPPFTPLINNKTLLPNVPDHRNTNHNTNDTDDTNGTNHKDAQNTTNDDKTDNNGQLDRAPTHKRTHSPPKDEEENNSEEEEEEDCEDDCEWLEEGPSLSDNIEAYLKDNPNSFFCPKDGQCGLFEPVVLSKIHRPSCEEEVERISAAGGAVSYGRVSGELAVTRSFGDINYKHPHNKGKDDFVSVRPHVHVLDLQPYDEFLILASDGLWDVISHKEAVDLISKYRSAGDSRQACEDLVDEALRKNSFDNVTVVFLSFKWTNSA